MGAAIKQSAISNPGYAAVATANYDLATAENSCKMSVIARTQGKWNYAGCDAVLNFATNQMKGVFRGHTLCWGNQVPSWVQALSAADKKTFLKTYIETVLKNYGTRAFAWDVVNEAITDNNRVTESLKSTVWYPAIPDVVDFAFTTARAAASKGVKLFYNDYNIAVVNTKSTRVYNMLKPIDRKSVV